MARKQKAAEQVKRIAWELHAKDIRRFSALQQYYLRVLGVTYPEAELRQQWDSTSDGRLGKQRDFPGYATVMAGMKKFTDIPVPALVIFGIPHGQGNSVENSTDPKVCETAKAYSAALTALTESQAKAFENAVPTAVWFGCVVRIITSFCRTKRTCYVKCGPFSVACGSG